LFVYGLSRAWRHPPVAHLLWLLVLLKLVAPPVVRVDGSALWRSSSTHARENGGFIEIREVWGTRPQIEVGGQYLVRGKYTLPPGERGMLYFYATASGAWGQTASLDLQSTAVDEREGEFALIHGMEGPGYFHLILTDPERYSRCFADVYFGTGDNVYR
jgi:hypothetical protein